jgi:Ca-activated chloride channel homolog
VAPRYIPGSPLEGEPVGAGTEPDTDAVPDASRITPPVLLPGFPNPVDLSIRARIDPAGLDLGAVRSSLPAVVEEEAGGVRVVRAQPGERANRDFVLRLRTGSDAVTTAVAAAADAEGGQGTFALTLLPPAGTEAPPARDVVLVLDRSGSMGGWKMVAARRAVARMVDSLTERDRFGLLAFDNLVETPPELGAGLQVAGDHARFQAVEYLARLEARGGTEMAAPLAQGLDLLTRSGAPEPHPPVPGRRELALVLVTDGQVGNEDQILRLLAPRLGGVRVYAVGVDSAVNEGFLKRLAGLGGGACELVESEDRLDEVMDRVHRRIGAPVLTDLELEPAGLDVDLGSLAPRRLPALFAGSPLVVSGRFAGRPDGAIVARGRDAAGQPWSATVPVSGGDPAALAPTWARAHLRDLEDRYATEPAPDRELERRIVDLSLRFGVLCRFTAFVAADVQVVNEGGVVHRVLQPVEAPAGWDMLSRIAGAMPMASMSVGGFQAPMARRLAARAPLGRPDGRLGAVAGRVGPGRTARRRSAGSPSHPLAGADLAPYRRRAIELALLLQSDRPGLGLGRRLGLVRVGVEALVADLESVDAAEQEVRPLRDLVAELNLPGARTATPTDLERLRDRALAVLRAFGGPAAPADPPVSDRRFWSRS